MAMLRISANERSVGTTVTLEGRLAGVWVDELRACWRSIAAVCDTRSVRIDLAGVTFVDTAGKALLRAVHEQGATLAASGCMMRATLEEITGTSAHSDRSAPAGLAPRTNGR